MDISLIINLVLVAVAVIFLGAGIGFAFLRGLPKSRIRGIRAIFCFGLSLFLTAFIKNSKLVSSKLIPLLESAIKDPDFSRFLNPAIEDGSVVGFLGALAAPLLFFVFFIVLEIVTGIICGIVFLILGERVKRRNCHAHVKGLRTAAWGFIAALCVLVALIVPISAYTGYLSTIASGTSDSLVQSDKELVEVRDALNNYCPMVENTYTIKTYHSLFGWLDDSLASFRVNGEKANAKIEVDRIVTTVGDLDWLISGGDLLDSDNANSIRRLASRMEKAPFFSSLVSTFAYEGLEDYMKSATDSEDAIAHILYIAAGVLHNDAKDPAKLKADLYTVADLLTVYAALDDSGLNAENLDRFIKVLSQNPNAQPILDEIKRLTREFMQDQIKFTKNESGEYDEAVTKAVDELNDIAKLPKAEQKEKVVNKAQTLLQGTEYAEKTETIDYFADIIVNELLPEQGGTLTPEDAENFLIDYVTEHYTELHEKGLI